MMFDGFASALYASEKMVRCMLWSAGVDLRYWGEAFMCAVHIRKTRSAQPVRSVRACRIISVISDMEGYEA